MMRCPDVDGALVGGASLLASSFARIALFQPQQTCRKDQQQSTQFLFLIYFDNKQRYYLFTCFQLNNPFIKVFYQIYTNLLMKDVSNPASFGSAIRSGQPTTSPHPLRRRRPLRRLRYPRCASQLSAAWTSSTVIGNKRDNNYQLLINRKSVCLPGPAE